MSKDILLAVAIGGAVLLVLQQQAKAKTAGTIRVQPSQQQYTPAPTKSVNTNGDMWARLLGKGYTALVKPGSVNGNGVPSYSGDPMADYLYQTGSGVGDAVDQYQGGGIDYETGETLMDWGNYA